MNRPIGSAGLLSRLSPGQLGAIFALVSVVPLALLTYFSVSLASDAVRREVEARVASTAATSAEVIRAEMQGLTELVTSYAERPSLVAALSDPARARDERALLRYHLQELHEQRGVYTTFLAKPDGTLIDIVPATPSIVGKDFSFRDWYKGVTRGRGPYVSEVYRTQATGRPLVVAAAALVRGERGRVLGILVAAYSVSHLQRFSDDLAAAEDVKLKITDQRGALFASSGEKLRSQISRRGDPRVVAALRGRSGITELDTPDGRRLSAYEPIPFLGWTVTASVPANSAFTAVGKLRSTVLTIAGVLGVILLAALLLLVRVLRERRRAEDDAARLANINRAVLDAAPDGIFLVDREGKLALKNAALDRLSDDGPVQPGANVYELLLEAGDQMSDPAAFRAAMQEIVADPEREAVHDLDRVDGKAFRLYTAPVREPSGELLGRVFVAHDRTPEREAERLKSELVATVSHELRTPLASVLGFAELLRHRAVDEATHRRYVDTIHSEAFRLTNLVNDFLDLQRIEEGHFTLALEPFDLDAVLREQIEIFAAQSKRHELDLQLPDEPLTLLGERERIAQVIGNLVSNAIKYSPQGGSVRVRCARKGDSVEVAVSDEGLGIPADQQHQLFMKFFRVDTSDTREIGGTGLGLALSREIIEAHGGRIGFESTEGEGSTFWFTLPVPQKTNGQGPRRILVVEDDPAAAALLGDYLAEDGYTFEFAASGEHALQRAIEDPPAVICLDVALAGELDGWDVLAKLKANDSTAQIPVIVCTGRNGRDRAAALGTADFITKPFSEKLIREAVARVLPQGRGSVLVVDDEPAVRRLVAETLSRDDVEVRQAGDGEEALAAIAHERPDAVVLDLIMPRLDGFQVLERLQADPETRSLPVIVLTARRLTPEERALLKERTGALLEKSAYSPQELRRLVARTLLASPE
jgi:signal transduction histidine kinase/DNA-binding response OmpR family regulator